MKTNYLSLSISKAFNGYILINEVGEQRVFTSLPSLQIYMNDLLNDKFEESEPLEVKLTPDIGWEERKINIDNMSDMISEKLLKGSGL